jgi:hypothetical protein
LNADQPAKIDRRALLMGAIFLVGGSAALVRFARDDGSREGEAPRLSSQRFALLEQVTEIVIPATDTPGAIDAGVPVFLRDLLGHWASEPTRNALLGVLETIEKRAWSQFGASFLELAAERRVEVVARIDAEAMATPDSDWSRFKYLTLLGYYHSEIGATQELRFELVPGAWRSCLPLDEVGRAAAV